MKKQISCYTIPNMTGKNGEIMARRADGGVRFRPVGSRHARALPEYDPRGIGCPAITQAVERLYRMQNEEGFWTLMSAVNYALEMETNVLVPLQTAYTVHAAPAPWVEHPIPAEKAEGLKLWTLRNDKGRNWLPLFTCTAAAGADRSTAARPMVQRTLQQAMELVLENDQIDGVVLDPWSHSATLDGALLGGLLRAAHEPEEPGEEDLECGHEAACQGNWALAADCYADAAEKGNAMGLTQLANCLYTGRGVRKNRTEARRMWKTAAESGDPLAYVALGDVCREEQDAGAALRMYRRAQQSARQMPDIQHTPYILLRMAQAETRYISVKKALRMAVEAQHGFAILQREGEPDADEWLRQARQLIRELTEQPPQRTAYNIESLQMD